ncbi:proline-, glutamic acid- and leucine-rich protein 1-like [Pseudomyrmex gracilis]|uniref:proline-, glutamic acid- and leucine-rich protein 1-like n=1 Tax=Pseudomyrmex gracilis TaxID=219809 RepID=UPI00099563A6|nr:proline-, glutamic acid- and leucine-rich protein 1-like [Pseudomyrmex gracilis]
MTTIIEIVNSFDVNSKEFQILVHDLMVNNSDVPFDSQEVDKIHNIVITGINSRVNQVSTRHDGLLMLDKILPRCSNDVFSKYGLLWIGKATQILENVHSSAEHVTLACKILGSLITRCREIAELHKQISMQHVKQLLNALSAIQTVAKCGAVYYLLAVLLYHYPEVCERYQESIREMILLQIDSAQKNLVNASAKCYVLLSKATQRSFKPPPTKLTYTGWIYNEALLCNNLHVIMDELFSGLIELESIKISDQITLPPISEENVIEYYNKQQQRFSNLCIYLSSMLRGYEAKNSVLPHDILQLLCRGLAITPLGLKNRASFKEQMLYIILPKLHISLFTVLDALINSFAEELIPFGNTMLQLFRQTLQWTSTVLENHTTFGQSKPFKSVKMCTYRCFSSWLKNTGSTSGIETIANKCATFIWKDVIPEQDRILLTVQQKTHHMSKRAIRRFKNSQYENSSILNNKEGSAKSECLDADLCREALVVLQNVLSSGSILLPVTFHQTVQKTVISLLYNLYLSSSEQNFYKNHSDCRLELFKLLKVSQMNPHTALAFPTQYCLEISQMAARDINLNIAQEAKLALAELEKIIHPAAPTLRLPEEDRGNQTVLENQIDKDQIDEIFGVNKSDKRNLTEENTNAVPCKRPKITAIEIIRNENNTQQSIELMEANDEATDADKSQEDNNSCNNIEKEEEEEEKEETNHISKENDEVFNSEQNQSNATSTNTESKMEVNECKLSINGEEEEKEREQSEDLVSCANQTDKTKKITSSEGISSESAEETNKRLSQKSEDWEEMDAEILESLNLFRDEVNE